MAACFPCAATSLAACHAATRLMDGAVIRESAERQAGVGAISVDQDCIVGCLWIQSVLGALADLE
ncbi:MAG: hypothetical protein NZX77_17690 [Polyangiaceae bacterium]|nr:hypothetical protein [Polyangiaceae bacterium]